MILDDAELELFARHVSLPEIGAPGQRRLLETRVSVAPEVPAREALLIGLERSGFELVSEDADVRIEHSELSPNGVVDLSATQVDVGPFDFSIANRLEASAALHIKQHWLGALLAGEVALAVLGKRPKHYTLICDFPHYRLHDGSR